jgi:hypothetical protein
MAIRKFFKIIEPKRDLFTALDNQDVSGNLGMYGNYTWYHRLVQGSASRMVRYREYDLMDNDVDVARALDLIAEEVAGNQAKTENPLLIQITAQQEQEVSSSVVVTLNAALKTWCNIQDWHNRLFPTIRRTIMYGDAFFIRPNKKFDKFLFVHPKNVVGAIVLEDDVTKVMGWHIKTDFKKTQNMPGMSREASFTGSNDPHAYNVANFSSDDVIRFTLNTDMSDESPFGESILRAVYKTFKQKELLEDALIIYRIQRAPERRVFKIEVGSMPPAKVAAHLEQVKNEFRQKRVPSPYGGQDRIESVYNPQSQNEDFFVPKRKGEGTDIEVLPAGMNLGQLEDLDFFFKKLWRGLRIPQSYMDNSAEGGSTFNDGKVGIAYMQEILFTLYIERLQKHMETTIDREFKRFLFDQNIKIDATIFKVILPQPTNFSKSREQAMSADLINNYNAIAENEHISPRMAQIKYLGWTKEEFIINQRMRLEEKGINPDTATKADIIRLYSPELAEEQGHDGGLPGGGGDFLDQPMNQDNSVTGEEEGLEGDDSDETSKADGGDNDKQQPPAKKPQK